MIGLPFYLKDSDNFFLHNIQLIIFYLHKLICFSTLNFSLMLKIVILMKVLVSVKYFLIFYILKLGNYQIYQKIFFYFNHTVHLHFHFTYIKLQWISNSSTLSYMQSYIYVPQTRICYTQIYIYVSQKCICYKRTYVYVLQTRICYMQTQIF